MARAARARRVEPKLDKQLVLNRFICAEFGFADMREMLEDFYVTIQERDDSFEGEYHPFIKRFFTREGCKIDTSDLQGYGHNIRLHSERLGLGPNDGRQWKPHQYLALLFMERYLDLWFADRDDLKDRLNAYRASDGLLADLPDYQTDELSTLAFQSATGSGKTLIMHAHILQYQHYSQHYGKRFNNIYLVTPDADMSAQHLRELQASGIAGGLFDKNLSSIGQQAGFVQIIDIHKIADESGVLTIDVRALGVQNLVLVDEGHLGQGGKEFSIWRRRRAQLATDGFTIEYSATFNQIATGALLTHYSKCLLFDYAYRHFYDDGYGKDHNIANLPAGLQDQNNRTWLTGCLLTFYQQMKIFDKFGGKWPDYNIERPLWVMLGHTVVTKRGELSASAKSDIVSIVEFLAWILGQRAAVEGEIQSILSDNPPFAGDWFKKRFSFLRADSSDPSALYDDLCQRLFYGTGQLHLTYLTQGEGEIHLTSSDGGKVFGVINVGAPEKVYSLVREDSELGIPTHRNTGFAKRLFSDVDIAGSPVTLLIGARKFVAGWNSWRVSTMTLLNVGQGQGPQIIQMFGRGVRLKGLNFSLKRHKSFKTPEPEHSNFLALLETLNIYGLRANYMEAFKKMLKDENVETERHSFPIEVSNGFPESLSLPMLKTKSGRVYKRHGETVRIDTTSPPQIAVLDLYPVIQTLNEDGQNINKTTHQFQPGEKALFDRTRIYNALVQYKQRRGMHNVKLSEQLVDQLLGSDSWYEMLAPVSTPASSVKTIKRQEQHFITLACRFVERCWQTNDWNFERQNKEIVTLTKNDNSLIKNYEISISGDHASAKQKYDELKRDIESLSATPEQFKISKLGLEIITPSFHAYTPILCQIGPSEVAVSPVPMNKGEYDTVCQLKKLAGKAPIESFNMYLLRNASKSGTGFLSNPSYYPDFICWLIGNTDENEGKTHMLFLDPKGMVHTGSNSPKFTLHREIKQIEKAIGDQNLKLHSYILSVSQDSSAEPDRGLFKLHNNQKCLEEVFKHALNGV